MRFLRENYLMYQDRIKDKTEESPSRGFRL